jgi:hypothetical protein
MFFSWRTRFAASAALETCTDNINTLAIVGIAATGLCAKTLELIAPDATGDFMSDGGGEDRHNQSSAGGSRPIKRRNRGIGADQENHFRGRNICPFRTATLGWLIRHTSRKGRRCLDACSNDGDIGLRRGFRADGR